MAVLARTNLNDSPRINTRFWDAIIRGAVKKKYAAVRWNSEIARMIVKAEMSAMAVRCKASYGPTVSSCYSKYLVKNYM